MKISTRCALLLGGLAWLAGPMTAAAQNPEGGDTQVTAQTSLSARTRGGRAGSGIRLGIQARIDAFNVLGVQEELGPISGLSSPMAPIVTPGIRFLDQRLFIGLGLGFSGASQDMGGGDSASRSALSLAPMAMFDVLTDEYGALSLGGWLNISSLGETEVCNNGDCMTANDDEFGWGLNLMAGVRGFLSPGLAIGAEFGWGFIDISSDAGDDRFVHGLVGMLLFEASLGL